jgi:hypothetical protein
MKKSLPIFLLIIALAMSSPVWAANVVYKLTYSASDDGGVGTSGTIGYYRVIYGDVYNEFDTLVGHYYMTLQILKPYTAAVGNQCFMTLHMVELESGGPPWYNFTLQGSYAYAEGIGYGAITNISEFPSSLAGAYFTIEYNPSPGYYWNITLHLP